FSVEVRPAATEWRRGYGNRIERMTPRGRAAAGLHRLARANRRRPAGSRAVRPACRTEQQQDRLRGWNLLGVALLGRIVELGDQPLELGREVAVRRELAQRARGVDPHAGDLELRGQRLVRGFVVAGGQR